MTVTVESNRLSSHPKNGRLIRSGKGSVQRIYPVTKLPNPYKHPTLRTLDGRNPKVQKYVCRSVEADRTLLAATAFVLDHHLTANVTVTFLCFGGKHRSVALAELLAERLRTNGIDPIIRHKALH